METLYFNGDIITMEPEEGPEAVLVRDGIIEAVGSYNELSRLASHPARVDLQGNTMIPAFLDAHSHITALAQTMHLAPLNSAATWEEIQQTLRKQKETLRLKPGEWLVGFGYDHNQLQEKQHPDKQILDEVSRENPILISHASGHMGVASTLALEAFGIHNSTPNPNGGKIGRSERGEPNGYLEENAFFSFTQRVPEPSMEVQRDSLEQAQAVYFSQGICTIQEGMANAQRIKLLSKMAEENRLKADIVAYIDLKSCAGLEKSYSLYAGKYHRHLKIGGNKIFLDGSPQGKTAWLSAPYLNSGEYRGYPAYTDAQVEELISQSLYSGTQLLAHCNGDAAADQYLRAYQKVWERTGRPSDTRPVMIHAQTIRRDQLPLLPPLTMIPSFFVAHTHYWGDVHIKNLGIQRASQISPARTAQSLGIPFTFHQDTPVLPPNMLDTLWCAVNRVTKDGVVLEGEQISPYEALKAVTIHAAYQYFEEDSKGSIRPGKQANFAMLSGNPCKCEPMQIRHIKVLQTILRGEAVYQISKNP